MRALLLLILASLAVHTGWSAEPAKNEEIEFLITTVETSGGHFIRNGTEYDGHQAADHLRMKLNRAGSRVQTPEQFIEGIASKSSISGSLYEIRLADGRTVPSGTWLTEALARHRRAVQR